MEGKQEYAKHIYCAMDVIHFLRIICKKKPVSVSLNSAEKKGQSLEESLWGGKVVQNFEIVWRN